MLFYYVPPPQNGPFTFLFVGVAQPRKGVDDLLLAFRDAFPSHITDVRLVIKSADWGKLDDLRAKYTDDRISWIHANMRLADLQQLYVQCHCFVLPTRAEAFSLPALEAMATGRPVIITAHGGHLDCCTDEASLLVSATLMPVENTLVAKMHGYRRPREWAVPDREALVARMREAYYNPSRIAALGAQASEMARMRWTWDAGVARVADVLRQLEGHA
jgi:glycosyltransferase involved in cell wall biosynthesis